jgi:hypothetical protein
MAVRHNDRRAVAGELLRVPPVTCGYGTGGLVWRRRHRTELQVLTATHQKAGLSSCQQPAAPQKARRSHPEKARRSFHILAPRFRPARRACQRDRNRGSTMTSSHRIKRRWARRSAACVRDVFRSEISRGRVLVPSIPLYVPRLFQRPDRLVMTYRITTYMAATVDQIAMTLTIAPSA